jgi:UDP-GlcNAc3NAcA epimerase
MPEELNRIMSDHASTLLFAPTNAAFKNLMKEGFRPENSPPFTIDNPKIYFTGDIMYDNTLFFAELAERKKTAWLNDLGLEPGRFILTTIHREANTDDISRLETILKTLSIMAGEYSMKFVMPLHPRTTNTLKAKLEPLYSELLKNLNITILPPVSFLEMTLLEKSSKMIITDSGGVQKESHFFKKPCLVLRKETEWIELVKNGTAVLVDADPDKIRKEFNRFMTVSVEPEYPGFYGDGRTSEFIIKEIMSLFDQS